MQYTLFIHNISLNLLDTSSASIDHGYYVLYTLQSMSLILAIELAY